MECPAAPGCRHRGHRKPVGTGPGPSDDAASDIPTVFALHQNYPNPFNPQTTISFALPAADHVRLTVSDLQGRTVAEMVNGIVAAGTQEVTFDATALPSGVYFYRLESTGVHLARRMVLIR